MGSCSGTRSWSGPGQGQRTAAGDLFFCWSCPECQCQCSSGVGPDHLELFKLEMRRSKLVSNPPTQLCQWFNFGWVCCVPPPPFPSWGCASSLLHVACTAVCPDSVGSSLPDHFSYMRLDWPQCEAASSSKLLVILAVLRVVHLELSLWTTGQTVFPSL